MSHPLDGARLKVVRAQEHLDVLKSEIRYYTHTHPYEILAERRNQIWEVKINPTVPPPAKLSLIIGDCLGNLRAALDYIIWELANRYATCALIIGVDRPYFPISDDPARHRNDLNSLAKKYAIPARACDEIEAVQPNHTGYELLLLLHAARNQDNHRLLLLTTSHVLDGELEIWPEGYPSPFRLRGNAAAFLETTIPTGGNAEPALVERNVKVKGQATISVALKDFVMPWAWGPVDRVLEDTIKCVAGIIPRFDSFV